MDSIEDSRVSTDFYKKLADEYFGETEDNRIGRILEFRTLLQVSQENKRLKPTYK